MKKSALAMIGIAVLSAIVYFASMAGYAFPGISATLRATWNGLSSVSQSAYPLMAIFAKLLGGGNLIAPVCGVISVALVYLLTAHFIRSKANTEEMSGKADGLGIVAGLVAAFVFMLTPAVRESASHLEPRLFDATWALAAFAILIPYAKSRGMISLLYVALFAAMMALGFCDTALFIALIPFAIVAITAITLEKGLKPYLPITIYVFVFIVVFLIARAMFGLELTDFLKGSAKEFREYYGEAGWIFVLIFSTIPFLVSLFSSSRAFTTKAPLVQWLFHLAMTVVVILAVATPLSPSSLLEKHGTLPVVTSAFAAFTAGYLAAYWFLRRRTPIGVASGVVLAFVLAFSCLWNLFTFDRDRGAFADEVARKILTDMGDRKWFVTDGTMDAHVKLVAAEQGKELNVISLQRDLDEDYLLELAKLAKAKQIGGDKNESLVLSLSLGVLPFVQDWFANDPTTRGNVVIWGAPDLWYSASVVPVPEFFFFGADTKRKADWSEWKRFDALLTAPKGWGSYKGFKDANPVERLRLSLRRHLGLVATDRGVALQDAKQNDEAFKMYELVLNEIDADNVCALFNEVEMAGAKYPKALARQKDLQRKVKSIVEDKTRRYSIWRLGSYYGYIRNPDMFVRLGFSWAKSGRAGDALSHIRRAIDFVPTDKRATLLNMMAALYASEDDRAKSREIYRDILAKNSKDHGALMGMMRLSLVEGDHDKALEYMQRAASVLPKEGSRAKIEQAMVAMMKNDNATATKLLKAVTEAEPKNLQAWSLTAAVLIQRHDASKDEAEKKKILKEISGTVLPAMEKNTTNPFDYYVQMTKGFLMMREGAEKRREARDAMAVAAKARPDSAATQDIVLGLDISLDDKENAEAHARDVLRRNRKAPLANYVMGSLAIRDGKFTDAEQYLRRAVDTAKPNVMALNDFAETLRRLKKYGEAEKYARQAIERVPEFYVAWETLGVIQLESGKDAAEAEKNIRKAIELYKKRTGNEDSRLFISLGKAQLKMGDLKSAKASVRKAQKDMKLFTDYERAELEALKKSVR